MNATNSISRFLFKWVMTLACIGVGFTAYAQPANDLCENAIPLTLPSTTSGTTVDATDTGNPDVTCSPLFRPIAPGPAPLGVWYVVTPTADGVLNINTCDPATTIDSRIDVFTGDCGSLTCIGVNDDDFGDCGGNGASNVSIDVMEGTTYYILVSNLFTDFGDGTFVLDVRLLTPSYVELEGGDCLTTFIDISGTGEELENPELIQLPFDFTYFGVEYPAPINLVAGAGTGQLTLSDGAAIGGTFNMPLFSDEFINEEGGALLGNALLPYWTQLNGGSLFLEIQGTEPNRTFILQWDNVSQGGSPGTATFQLQIDEATSNFSFLYPDLDFGDPQYDNGGEVTVGFQGTDANGDRVWQQFSHSNTFNGFLEPTANPALISGTCLSYVPIPPPVVATEPLPAFGGKWGLLAFGFMIIGIATFAYRRM